MKIATLNKTLLTTAASVLVLQAASSPASAQLVLEEVMVTAQKREQTLEDIPGSVSSISADQLDKTNTSNFNDLGKITAGLHLESTRDGNSPILKIRGIGTQRFNAAVSPSVGIYVDEIAKPRIDTAFTNLNDVERIEILKGPQATLYGKQVSAGLISIITAKPVLDEFLGKVQAKVGSADLLETRGMVNVPMSDVAAGRFNAYYTQSTFDQVEDVISGESEETETLGGRARLLYLPHDNLEAILSLEYHENETKHIGQERIDYAPNHLSFLAADAAADGVPVNPDTGLPLDLLPADPFDGKIQVGELGSRQTETFAAALHIAWDLDENWTINSISSYEDYERTPISGDEFFSDGASSAITGGAVVAGAVGVPGALLFSNEVSDENYSQELRATYSGENLSSIIGLYYADSSQETITNISRRINAAFNNPILSSIDKNTEDIAIFTHNSLSLNDDMEVTFGLRYAETSKSDATGTIVGGGSFAPDPVVIPIPEQDDTWEAFSGTLKFIYYLEDDVSAYAGYDRGFKAGGFNNPVAIGGAFPTDPTPGFDEEIADNFEVGIKGRFFEQRLRWSLAVFYQTYEDFQLPIPNQLTGIGLITQNAGEVVSQGIETEFTWLASEHWVIDGNVAYIDSFYDEYENAGCFDGQVAGCVDGTQDLTDADVDNHSPWSATLNATYEADLGDSGLTWFGRGEASYRDDVIGLSNHDPRAMQDGFTLYNASFGINAEDRSWTVVLWGKNLADEEYISTYLLASDEGIPGNIRSVLGRPGEERSYGLDFTYRF